MTTDTLICRDIYMRHTDGDGHSHVMCHRVWDADRFVASQVDAAKKVAQDAFDKNKPFGHKAEQITDEAYFKERTK